MVLSLIRRGLTRDLPPREIPATPDLRPGYDVCIIGGGGHGLACAYYLAKHHGITRVAILEKNWLAGGNTARNTAVIRSNYVSPQSVRFYKESVDLYAGLSNELGYNILFTRRGQLTLAQTDATLRSFRLRREVNTHLGGRTEILDAQQVKELVPTLDMAAGGRRPFIGGLWHIDGGTARHDAVAWGYAVNAAAMGVEIHQRTEVTGVERDGDKVTALITNRGRVACGQVVQAVAGMSSEVARLAGIQLPIETVPLQAMVTEPLKPFLDPLVSAPDMHAYVQQTARGELVIGGGPDPYPLYSTRSTLDYMENLSASFLRMFPFLHDVSILRQWAGICDETPDYTPIMGASPLVNWWLDAGWGTWGFKATPVAGKRMAETVATGRVPDILLPFRLERFRDFALVNEMGATAAAH